MKNLTKKISIVGLVILILSGCSTNNDNETKKESKSTYNKDITFKATYLQGEQENSLANFDEIESSLNELTNDSSSVVLLMPSEPINDVEYLLSQYTLSGDNFAEGDKKSFYLKTAIVKNGEAKYYTYITDDVKEVIEINKSFYEKQKTPDLSEWEITNY